MRCTRFLSRFALLAAITVTCASAENRDEGPMPLAQVRTFMYQLQNLEQPGAVEALAKSPYDLIVIEPTAWVKGNEDFDIEAAVAAIRAGKPGRLVIAYIDPCQAERFRTYWQDNWKPPKGKKPGNPAFLLTADPDGWTDDFNVAYWDEAWQDLFITGENSELRQIMTAGFDGLYLDWIDAFEDPTTVKAAKKAGIDPATAMVDFLLLIRQTAREINPDAVIIQQNAIYLPDADPRWTDAIDAVGVEDTWFGGRANAKWGTKKAGDIPNKYKGDSSTAARLDQYAKIQSLGKPVLTIDYCRNEKNATTVYTEARKRNLIPLVTQISLDRITETPPP